MKRLQPCPWCHDGPVERLCDAVLPDGRTCNNGMCRYCADVFSSFHIRYIRRHPVTGCRGTVDTLERCPACREAGRTTENLTLARREQKAKQWSLFE